MARTYGLPCGVHDTRRAAMRCFATHGRHAYALHDRYWRKTCSTDRMPAALIRHCEAFGIQEMHTDRDTVCKFDPNRRYRPRHRPMGRRAAPQLNRWGARRTCAGTGLPHRGDHASPRGQDARDVRRHARAPFALVFGTEHAGISDEVVAAADEFLRIPMCGMVESLNVSASAAILIYMLSERVRHTVPRLAPGPPARRAEVLYRWTIASACRTPKGILAANIPKNTKHDEYRSSRKQFLAHVGQTSPDPDDGRGGPRRRVVLLYALKENATTTWSPGVSVSNVGHCQSPPSWKAVQEQAARLHAHHGLWRDDRDGRRCEYAARIADAAAGRAFERLFRQFGRRSDRRGPEARQALYTHRTELVSMRRAYHGSTQGADEPDG